MSTRVVCKCLLVQVEVDGNVRVELVVAVALCGFVAAGTNAKGPVPVIELGLALDEGALVLFKDVVDASEHIRVLSGIEGQCLGRVVLQVEE